MEPEPIWAACARPKGRPSHKWPWNGAWRTLQSMCYALTGLPVCACRLAGRPSVTLADMSAYTRTSPEMRLLAIKCYIQADEDIEEACARFREMCTGTPPANVSEFIHYWWEAFTSRYSLLDERHGRTPKVSDSIAEHCVQLVWEGYWSEGYHLAPLDFKDALEHIPALERIRRRLDVEADTLWQHMRRVAPGLQRRLLVFKAKLSNAHKMERWDLASKLRRYTVEELLRVFWIDATSIYVVPKGFSALVPPGASLVIEDERMPQDFRHAIVLRFYCCVNGVAGPVAIKFHTGTTKFKPPKKYMVSAGVPIWGRAFAVFCMAHVTWSLHPAPVRVCR